MTARDVLAAVANMPQVEWLKIQRGLADMICAQFSEQQINEVQDALLESEAEYHRREGIDGAEARRRLGLV